MQVLISLFSKTFFNCFYKIFCFVVSVLLLILTSSGVSFAQWSTDPKVNNPICVLPGNQDNAMAIVDGTGGTIVSWVDFRNGNFALYVQRINASGVTQWAANGVQICNIPNDAGDLTERYKLVADGAGGAYLIWADSRAGSNRDIYGQRINASGVVQWAANGVAIAATATDESLNGIVTDGAGGIIVAWTNGLGYVQRINSSGALQWGAAGQTVGTMAPGGSVLPVADGAGGAITVWEGPNSGLYAQRFNNTGNKQWAADGVMTYSGPRWDLAGVTTDGASGAVALWVEDRLGNSKNVHYAQKINAAGVIQWAAAGVPVITSSASARNQAYGLITTDMAGGAFIAWINAADQDINEQVYVQRINQAGTTVLDPDGFRLSQTTQRQMTPAIVSDNSGGAIVSWADRRSDFSQWDIYAQRINATGTRLWPLQGLAVIEADENQTEARLVPDGNGGAFIMGGWDFRNVDTPGDIYVQKVCSNGTMGACAPDPTKPDMKVTYRLITIADGDTSPSVTLGTDFGDVYIDSALVSDFFIINPSDANLVIIETTLTGPDSSAFLHGMVPGELTIPPHDSVMLGVGFFPSNPFAPGTLGIKNATLRMVTNVEGKNPYTFAVRGNAIARCGMKRFYWDGDKDGYGNAPEWIDRDVCVAPTGFVENALDCDDTNPAVHPGAAETCNGIDDNCDGKIDEGFAQNTFYRDADVDGYGNPAVTIKACIAPHGYVANNQDCNDANSDAHPGATEVCNGKDDDCDGQIDEGNILYRDADGDGYGNPAVSTVSCTNLAGYVTNKTDCNDASAAVHPGAVETVNGIDDNCDGQVDEGTTLKTFYRDADGDQYGNAAVTTTAAAAPTGYVDNKTDCDDANAAVHPGVQEICNGIDDDCNGQVDDNATQNVFYRDADGDGYGNAAQTTEACEAPAGYVADNTDCNDANANVHPGATEICNGIDDDCDGQTDEVVTNTTVSIGDDVKSYFGYLPDQCITKTATVTNGIAPYTYFWTLDRSLLTNVITPDGDETMTGVNSPSADICLLDTANLCVTVTDANGCMFTGCANILASDVRCFADNSGGQKINVCHEGSTICISQSDLADHLAHGDYIGSCVAGFTTFPNPSAGELKVSLSLPDNTSSGEIQVVNINGHVVKRIIVSQQQNVVNISLNESGLYLIRLIVNKQTFTKQVTVIR